MLTRDVALARRLAYLASFRIGLVSVLLVAVVAVDAVSGTVSLGQGPFGGFLLAIIGAAYVLCVTYVVLQRRTKGDLEAFGMAQVAGDLALSSCLVHATGGALSAFAFLYPMSALVAAVIFYRRGALLVALAGSTLFVAVAIGGYRGLIPPIPGQRVLPWELPGEELVRILTTNVAASFAVGILGSYLGGELRIARAQVQAQEKFIRDLALLNEAIVRSLPSGLISTDRQLCVRTVNRVAQEMLGLDANALVGRRLGEIAPGFQEAVEQSAEQPVVRVEIPIARPDGSSLPTALWGAALRGQDGAIVGWVLSFQDLTPIRAMEATVRRAEHLAGIGRLAAGVAHELRNPLAAMSGAIELLQRTDGLDVEERQLMDIVGREVLRLSQLVEGLLQFARPQPPHCVSIDLVSLVEDVVRMFRESEARRGIEVVVRAQGRARASADSSQLRQVLWNLLRNSAEASETGQCIEVHVGGEQGRSCIKVRDYGPGFSPEAKRRLFEPFFTTKERGTGLGLATARRILDEHGGDLEVADAQPRGAVVRISLAAS